MLTSKQNQILKDSNFFVVKACPGAGKTFAVSYLIKHELDKGNKVLALSFSNVAKNEIIEALKSEHEISLNYPHDILTIDSFLNKYVFDKYSYLMRSNGFNLIGEPATRNDIFGRYYKNSLLKINLKYDSESKKLSFVDNGVTLRDVSINTLDIDALKKDRLSKLKLGYVTQKDVNDLSLYFIEKYPSISKVIASRFDTLIIDEAQDTSLLKMKIIDELIDKGLSKVVIIGDPDQSIYQWNDAKPELFNHKYEVWEDSFELNESRRCSQLICKLISRFSSHDLISSVQYIDRGFVPQLVSYKDNCELQEVHLSFLEYCSSIEVESEHIAVLYRSASIKSIILGIKEEKPMDITNKTSKLISFLLVAKIYYDEKRLSDAMDFMARFYLTYIGYDKYVNKWSVRQYEQDNDKFAFRNEMMNYMILIPDFSDITLKKWIGLINENFVANGIDIEVPIEDFKGKTKKVTTVISRIYDNKSVTDLNVTYSTVHGVKGKTYKAVMLVLKSRPPKGSYRKLIENGNFKDEEIRIIYVAMSRAADALWLVVPEKSESIWKEFFLQEKEAV